MGSGDPRVVDCARSLSPLLHGERDGHRDRAIYGYWGSSVNVTDGEYTYLHPCDGSVDAACHSTEMMNALGPFQPREPEFDAEAGEFLPYTESPVWRWSTYATGRHDDPMLFDVSADPEQETDLAGEGREEEDRMRSLLVDALDHLDAPASQYERLGLAR